jgi:hypothetical protein
MRKFIVPLAVGIVASLVFSGCRPQPPEIPPYPEEMPCGIIVDLSGPYAEMGNRLSAGAEVAIKQMNDWGGIRNMLSMDLRLMTEVHLRRRLPRPSG